jgi:hypothetical protein
MGGEGSSVECETVLSVIKIIHQQETAWNGKCMVTDTLLGKWTWDDSSQNACILCAYGIGEKRMYKNLRDIWESYSLKIETKVRKYYYLTKQWVLDWTGSRFNVKCVDQSRCNNRSLPVSEIMS